VPDRPLPVLIAHRGDRASHPENTLPALLRAVELGVGAVEFDVHLSADGECVVLHDDTVDRTTDGTGAVAALPWAALRELDAGAWWTPHQDPELANGGIRIGPTPFRGQGIRIPRLAEVLEALPDTPLIVELKTDAVATPALDMLDRLAGRRERILIGAFSTEAVVAARRRGYRTCAAERELISRLPGVLLGASYAQPPFDVAALPTRWMGLPVPAREFARACDVPVYLWAVNDPAAARRYVAQGVAGLLSDAPQRLLEAVPPIAWGPGWG
jgi:glycerophosphoryl diester phosphodiesterase